MTTTTETPAPAAAPETGAAPAVAPPVQETSVAPPPPAPPRPAPPPAAPPSPAAPATPGAPAPAGPGGPRPMQGGPGGPRPMGGPGGPRPFGGPGGPRTGPGGPRPYGQRGSRPGGRPRGRYAPRRRVCSFCVEHIQDIDYKDYERLRRFVSDRAKIEPRRKSGVCAKHQRALSNAIKRARHLALLPFVPLPPLRSSIRR